MTDYRISFFKNLVSSDGHCFKCLQGVVEVRGSPGVAQAIETASREFEVQHGLRDWRSHADLVEVFSTEATESHDQPVIPAAEPASVTTQRHA